MREGDPQGADDRVIDHRASCPSTMDIVREAALAGAPAGTVASTDYQSAGRGRRGRTWSAPPGTAVMLSYLARPARPIAALGPLPLAVGVAVCDALPLPVRLRWPNDVVVDGGKLAGILVELAAPPGQAPFAIIGIGVNAGMRREDLPPTDRLPATSLLLETGRDVDRLALRDRIAAGLDEALARFDEEGLAAVRGRLDELDDLAGRRLVLRLPGGEAGGTAAGIDDEGRLLLRDGLGAVRPFAAGEVERVVD